jgi:4-hydroxybenzoate polyprenyltransferase/geranylgeranylglycerol-phosphate geranylgeranyltransferase
MTFLDRARTKALAHLEMTRPYTVFHAGLASIAGVELASGGHVAVWRTALAGLVTICGWEAGLYAGDYYDREIDARSKPYRPVPSGRVSPREAFLTMCGLIAVGYLAALALGIANLILAVATTVLGIAYSKTFKSMAILGNFDRGVLGICAVLFGGLAGGNIWQPSVLLLAGLVFFHDSATNLVGAIRDVDGDRAAGCRTVPVVYGLVPAVDIAVALALAWAACGIALLIVVRPGVLSLALFAAALLLALGVYGSLWVTRRHATRPGALRAHKYLVVERLVLMSAFIATYAPAPAALGLLAATGLATIASQQLLRDRSERQKITPPATGTAETT